MKELTRTQFAVVKRTAQNVKGLRTKLNKLVDKIALLNAEVVSLQSTIDKFEAPIVEMTGGFTSEQVLNGEMNAAIDTAELNEDADIEAAPMNETFAGYPQVEEENVKFEAENISESVNEPIPSDEIPYI